MSPRNDTFLSLCLAQAELSPLHYRHGSIIVRGGKVIGQGFNSYRGGSALKTGILATTALDGPAIAELKQRLKPKKLKLKHTAENHQENQQDLGTFTPFESTGCGHNSNSPLSMHSEMMAIRSALSLSSGTQSSQMSARSAKYSQKPCFSLPGDAKKRKARAKGLKAYAQAVCAEAAETSTGRYYDGKFSLQKQGFEPGPPQPGLQGQQQVQGRGGQQVSPGGAAVHGIETREKWGETPNGKGARGSLYKRAQQVLSSRAFSQSLST